MCYTPQKIGPCGACAFRLERLLAATLYLALEQWLQCHPEALGVADYSPVDMLPCQSPRGGRQESISPQEQWFSKVKISLRHGFEGVYPHLHSGVVGVRCNYVKVSAPKRPGPPWALL